MVLLPGGQAARSQLEKNLVLRKRAVRLTNFVHFRNYAIPYFISSNIMPISMLYFKLPSVLMHDVSNNSGPPNNVTAS